jgi:hypothetical protein
VLGDHYPRVLIFKATSRLSLVSRARYTSPMPFGDSDRRSGRAQSLSPEERLLFSVYFFKSACQLRTTVIGVGAACTPWFGGTIIMKRLLSPVTSQPLLARAANNCLGVPI